MTIAAITEKYSLERVTGFFPGAVVVGTPEAARGADVVIDLDFVNEEVRCTALSRLQPALVIVNAVTPTIKEIGYPFVRINGWEGFLDRPVHELVVPGEAASGSTMQRGPAAADVAAMQRGSAAADAAAAANVATSEWALRVAELYGQLGRDYRLVPDVPGMISARVLSTIINEAYFTWEADVSTMEEIDTAMRLGTNYPLGPFEWSRRIGLGQIAGLLGSLSSTNPAYVPSEALLRAVETGDEN